MKKKAIKKMNKTVYSFILLSLFLFIFLGLGFTDEPSDKQPTYQFTGTVESISATEIIVIHETKGYFTDTHNFIINEKTVISRGVRPGITITVTYTLKRVDNRREKKTAVSIQVVEPTTQKK